MSGGKRGGRTGAWAGGEGRVEAEDKDRESHGALARLVVQAKEGWERGSKGEARQLRQVLAE